MEELYHIVNGFKWVCIQLVNIRDVIKARVCLYIGHNGWVLLNQHKSEPRSSLGDESDHEKGTEINDKASRWRAGWMESSGKPGTSAMDGSGSGSDESIMDGSGKWMEGSGVATLGLLDGSGVSEWVDKAAARVGDGSGFEFIDGSGASGRYVGQSGEMDGSTSGSLGSHVYGAIHGLNEEELDPDLLLSALKKTKMADIYVYNVKQFIGMLLLSIMVISVDS